MSETLELEIPKGRKKAKAAELPPAAAPAEAPYEVGGRIRWRRKGTEYAGRIVRVLCNCLIVEDEEQPVLERQIGCWYLDPETTVLDYSEPIEYAE